MTTGIQSNAGGSRTLKDVEPGTEVTVKKVHGSGTVRKHILDLGITNGSKIFVRRVAPLGGPLQISLRGYELCLRKHDAENIEVE